MDKNIHAFAVNDRNIIVKCPHHKYHTHGSMKNLKNREEGRVSHCDKMDYNNIIIDDDTLRCYIGKTGKPLKRSFKIMKKFM